LPRVPDGLVPVHVRVARLGRQGCTPPGHRPRALPARRGHVAEPPSVLVDRGDERRLDPDAQRARLRAVRAHRQPSAGLPRPPVLQAPEAVGGTTVSAKQELLNEAARQYKAFHESIQGLNEEQMTQVWLGTWCVRDIVAHISGWHRELAPALLRITRGERPVPEGKSYDDVDAWNETFAAARRTTTVAEVLLELDKSHETFLHAAAQVPEERFLEGKTAWRIVDGNSAHHYKEHADQIRAWRAEKRI